MTKDDHVMSNITNKQFFKNYGYSQVDILKIKPGYDLDLTLET